MWDYFFTEMKKTNYYKELAKFINSEYKSKVCFPPYNDIFRAYHLTEYENVKCVITDIEMPQMDGHHLTKLIKEDEEMKNLPVIIFSSLVNDEMRRKGELLGADAQMSKPEIGSLVKVLDDIIARYHNA